MKVCNFDVLGFDKLRSLIIATSSTNEKTKVSSALKRHRLFRVMKLLVSSGVHNSEASTALAGG